MSKYYITNEIWVDRETERTLTTNGETGDRRVRLVTAMNGETHYFYLITNGDPVPLLDHDPDHSRDFVVTLGMTPDEVIGIIQADGSSDDHTWACDQVRRAA